MLLLEEHGYNTSAVGRLQQHAFWNTLWLLHLGLVKNIDWKRGTTVADLKQIFDGIQYSSRRSRMLRRAAKLTADEVWRVYKKMSKQDPDKWTPNNFFKQTPGIEGLLRTVFPRIKKELEWAGQQFNTKN
jgi:hypothetical protein